MIMFFFDLIVSDRNFRFYKNFREYNDFIIWGILFYSFVMLRIRVLIGFIVKIFFWLIDKICCIVGNRKVMLCVIYIVDWWFGRLNNGYNGDGGGGWRSKWLFCGVCLVLCEFLLWLFWIFYINLVGIDVEVVCLLNLVKWNLCLINVKLLDWIICV